MSDKLTVGKFGAAIAESSRNKGRFVTTEAGATGRVYNCDPEVRGKLLVYLDGGARIMCHPRKLTITGYFD